MTEVEVFTNGAWRPARAYQAHAFKEFLKDPSKPFVYNKDGYRFTVEGDKLWGFYMVREDRSCMPIRQAGDPAVLPSSSRWKEARKRHADQGVRVSYGNVLTIPAGSGYYVDDNGSVLVGWHGSYDPPRGMDGAPMV